jgi:hypothetical protein
MNLIMMVDIDVIGHYIRLKPDIIGEQGMRVQRRGGGTNETVAGPAFAIESLPQPPLDPPSPRIVHLGRSPAPRRPRQAPCTCCRLLLPFWDAPDPDETDEGSEVAEHLSPAAATGLRPLVNEGFPLHRRCGKHPDSASRESECQALGGSGLFFGGSNTGLLLRQSRSLPCPT